MSLDHNRIKVADLEKGEPNKILITNVDGELAFSDMDNPALSGNFVHRTGEVDEEINGKKTFRPTITAIANGQDLSGMEITTVFSDGGFTDINTSGLRIFNDGPQITFSPIGTSTGDSSHLFQQSNGQLNIKSGNGVISLDNCGLYNVNGIHSAVNSTFDLPIEGGSITLKTNEIEYFKLYNSGNIGVQSGGDFIDNGVDKLQVSGSLIANSIKKVDGTSSQFLMADGSVTTSAGSTVNIVGAQIRGAFSDSQAPIDAGLKQTDLYIDYNDSQIVKSIWTGDYEENYLHLITSYGGSGSSGIISTKLTGNYTITKYVSNGNDIDVDYILDVFVDDSGDSQQLISTGYMSAPNCLIKVVNNDNNKEYSLRILNKNQDEFFAPINGDATSGGGGVVAIPTLQEVILAGGRAELDGGNSYLEYSMDGSQSEFSVYADDPNTGNNGQFSVNKSGVGLYMTSPTTNSNLNINEGNGGLTMNVTDVATTASTNVGFLTPVINTNLNFPAPTAQGAYTLPISINGIFANSAGNIEISGAGGVISTPTLQQILNSGYASTATNEFGTNNIGFLPQATYITNKAVDETRWSTIDVGQSGASISTIYDTTSSASFSTGNAIPTINSMYLGGNSSFSIGTPIPDIFTQITTPSPLTGGSYTLPISVNGNFADVNGNIEISGGGSGSTPSLQQVVDTDGRITNPNSVIEFVNEVESDGYTSTYSNTYKLDEISFTKTLNDSYGTQYDRAALNLGNLGLNSYVDQDGVFTSSQASLNSQVGKSSLELGSYSNSLGNGFHNYLSLNSWSQSFKNEIDFSTYSDGDLSGETRRSTKISDANIQAGKFVILDLPDTVEYGADANNYYHYTLPVTVNNIPADSNGNITISGGGSTPTLQEVVATGGTSNLPINISVENDNAILAYSTNGVGSYNYSSSGFGSVNESDSGFGSINQSTFGVASIYNIGSSNVNNIVEYKKDNVVQSSISHDGVVKANGFKTPTGTSTEYLMADGSVTTSSDGGGSQDLQSVVTNGGLAILTDASETTLYSAIQLTASGGRGSSYLQGRKANLEATVGTTDGFAFMEQRDTITEKKTLFRFINPVSNSTVNIPSPTTEGSYTLPLSVNNTFADASGNITISSDSLELKTINGESISGTGDLELSPMDHSHPLQDIFDTSSTATVSGDLDITSNTIRLATSTGEFTLDSGVNHMNILADRFNFITNNHTILNPLFFIQENTSDTDEAEFQSEAGGFNFIPATGKEFRVNDNRVLTTADDISGTQGLQSVLDNGTEAVVESTNNSVALLKSDGFGGYGNTFKIDTYSLNERRSSIDEKAYAVTLSNESSTDVGYIAINTGNIILNQYNKATGNSTYLNFTTPTAGTNIYIPAPPKTGNYTLALTSDLRNLAEADGTTLWHKAVVTDVGFVSSVGTSWTGTGTSITDDMVGAKLTIEGVGTAIIQGVDSGAQTFTTLQPLPINVTSSTFSIRAVAYKINDDGSQDRFGQNGNKVETIEASGGINYQGNNMYIGTNGNITINGYLFKKDQIELRDNNVQANTFSTNVLYAVAELPTPERPTYATVSDALSPTYMTAVVGGGAVVCPVFYNGTTWVAH